jgi:hypothetical protein
MSVKLQNLITLTMKSFLLCEMLHFGRRTILTLVSYQNIPRHIQERSSVQIMSFHIKKFHTCSYKFLPHTTKC